MISRLASELLKLGARILVVASEVRTRGPFQLSSSGLFFW